MSKRVEIKLIEPSDNDIIAFLDSDKRKNSDIIREALRSYMANTPNNSNNNEDERFKRLMKEVLSEFNLQVSSQNVTNKNSKLGSTGFNPKKL